MGDENKPDSEKTQANRLRDVLYKQIYPQVENGVNEGVEDEKNRIRRGGTAPGAGFWEQLWAAIKGFIFQIAEALGFDKWLAKAFGMPIPEKQDVAALSGQITHSITDVLTEKDASGKSTAANLSPDELEKKIKEKIETDIQANPNIMESFKKEKGRIAADAAAGIKENFDKIRTFLPSKPTVTAASLTGTPTEQVGILLNTIAADMLNGVPADKREQAEKLKPTMVGIGTKIIMEHPELVDKPEALAKLYVDTLQKDAALTHKLKNLDSRLDLNDEDVRFGMSVMMQNQLEAYHDPLANAIKGKAAAIEAPKPVDQLPGIKRLIGGKIAEGIKVGVADEVFLSGKGSDIERKILLDSKNHKPAPGSQEETDMKQAQTNLYLYAVSWKSAPNNEQRRMLGEIAATTITDILRDPNNKDLSQKDLADKLQKELEQKWKDNEQSLDTAGKGLTIAAINRPFNPFGDKGDILKKIATEVANKLRDTEDQEGVYKAMKQTQAMLLTAQVATAGAKAKETGAVDDKTKKTVKSDGTPRTPNGVPPEGRSPTPASPQSLNSVNGVGD